MILYQYYTDRRYWFTNLWRSIPYSSQTMRYPYGFETQNSCQKRKIVAKVRQNVYRQI